MDRKNFIKSCGYTCLGGSVLFTLLQSCTSTHYFARTNFENNTFIISKSEFFIEKKAKTIERKFVLIKSEKYKYPIFIYKIEQDSYSALLLQCTHKGCELRPQAKFLVCPCHGSEFDHLGNVQKPPAEQNLTTFKTTTDNENIFVYI